MDARDRPDEIEVTDEMQRAGAEVVWSYVSHEAPGPIALMMVKDVFSEMYRVYINSFISTIEESNVKQGCTTA